MITKILSVTRDNYIVFVAVIGIPVFQKNIDDLLEFFPMYYTSVVFVEDDLNGKCEII